MNGRKTGRLNKNAKINILTLESTAIIPQTSIAPPSSLIIDIKKQKSNRSDNINDADENAMKDDKRESEYLVKTKQSLIQMPHSVNDVDIKLTFIIPTIGRSTLEKTIKSLQYQTSKNWYAIIIFDGMEPTFTCKDPRIKMLTCHKLGEGKNHAGKVRNYGMTFVKTDWIAFLDDDDSISSKYVETFYEEIKNYKTDVIIFRMYFEYDIHPDLKTNDFYRGKVGISFVIKKDIIDDGLFFSPSKYEDYEYLSLLRSKNYTIMISPYVLYFVREYNVDCIVNGNRVFINEKQNNGKDIAATSIDILEEEPAVEKEEPAVEKEEPAVEKEEPIDISLYAIDPTFNVDTGKKINYFEARHKTFEYRSASYYYHKKYRKIRIEDELKVLNIVVE